MSEDVERKIWYKNQCMAPKSTRLIVLRKFSTYQSAMYTQGSPMYLQKAALDRSTQPSSVPSLWGAIVGLRGCELSCSGAKRTTMASRAVARCRSARGRQRAGRRAARWCAEVHRRDGPRERCARERGATASHERRRLLVSGRARAARCLSVCFGYAAWWGSGAARLLDEGAPTVRTARRAPLRVENWVLRRLRAANTSECCPFWRNETLGADQRNGAFSGG